MDYRCYILGISTNLKPMNFTRKDFFPSFPKIYNILLQDIKSNNILNSQILSSDMN